MKKFFLVFGLAMVLCASQAWADEGFYVVGGGGAVGTKISSLPFPINAPGFYYLTKNLEAPAGQNGITINADNVTLDLMGFKLSGPAWDNTGILLSGLRTAVEIRNGSLINWADCIYGESENTNIRVTNVRVQSFSHGIYLMGKGHLIKNCQAKSTIESFILGDGIVSGCTVVGNANSNKGISIINGLITGNYVENITGQGMYCKNGVISGNTASACETGIMSSPRYYDPFGLLRDIPAATISGNAVTSCKTGIRGGCGASIIGNSVSTDTDQTNVGIDCSGNNDPNILAQNSVCGAGTHFKAGGGSVNVANTNAGF